MRLLATIASLGTLIFVAEVQAQSLAEHGAAAAGATIGTAAGKPLSGAITKIFGDTDDTVKTANTGSAKTKRTIPAADKPTPAGPSSVTVTPGSTTPELGPAAGGASGGTTTLPAQLLPESRRPVARRRKQPTTDATANLEPAHTPVAPPVVIEPPAPKEPTPQEVAGIQVGASEHDVLAALGQPASHVSIPDDDGHLRESFQYWAKGSQIGTIRLDNGVVVKVDASRF